MQKTILILLSILLFSSCKHDENSIEFTKFANLDLGNLSKESATLRADAIFMNHSQNAFNLKDITIDFSIDGKDVGTIVVKKDKVIQPNSEFTIPIKYEYATNSFLEPNHEPSGTYAVQLLGDINFTNENKEEQAAKIKYAMTYEYLTKKEIRIEKRVTKEVIDKTNSALKPVWDLCQKYSCTKTQLALSYILCYPAVSTVIPGIRNHQQVALNTTGLFALSTEDRMLIEELGETKLLEVMDLIKQQG